MKNRIMFGVILACVFLVVGCRDKNPAGPGDTTGATLSPPSWLQGTWQNVDENIKAIVTSNNYQIYYIEPEMLAYDFGLYRESGVITSVDSDASSYTMNWPGDKKIITTKTGTDTIELKFYENGQYTDAYTLTKVS